MIRCTVMEMGNCQPSDTPVKLGMPLRQQACATEKDVLSRAVLWPTKQSAYSNSDFISARASWLWPRTMEAKAAAVIRKWMSISCASSSPTLQKLMFQLQPSGTSGL